MIAFGLSIAEPEPYRRFSGPGIEQVAEAGSERFVFASVGSIARTYNLILDAAGRRDDLEALVLVHPYTQLDDPHFCEKVRRALADPDVAVAGSIGATGVNGLAWWRGGVCAAEVIQDYKLFGEGRVRAFGWANPSQPPGDVDSVDGFLMILSPWAVRELRFDELLIYGYGFDVDFCLQARAAGRRVVVADLRAVLHRELELIDKEELWVEAHKSFAAKWEGRWPGAPSDTADWKTRARRAEAEREAERAAAVSRELVAEARVAALEREMDEATGSRAWRLTEPLRRLNQLRRERRRARA